jgi:hypothetical protein
MMKFLLGSAAIGGLLATGPLANAGELPARKQLPACTGLAAIVKQDENVLSVTSAVTAASGTNLAYCEVDLEVAPAINIRIGLPLSTADGGSGGLQGAWNGRVENLGGGGFAGTVGAVTTATNAGYVGSSTDTGHNAAWCNAINAKTGQPNAQTPNCGVSGGGFVLDPNNHLLAYQVQDFIDIGIHEQVEWALLLAKHYYGREAVRNYWNGCSTGGRQGFDLAQNHGELFDGILAGSPAFSWNRFQIGTLWPAVVSLQNSYTATGTASIISTAKTNAANAAAVAACDAVDGVVDGVINEPRRCHFNASALACTGSPNDAATCLQPWEVQTVNQIWNGPVNLRGERLWGGAVYGTPFATLTGTTASPGFGIPVAIVLYWMEQNPTYAWSTWPAGPQTITEANFSTYFQLSDRKFAETRPPGPAGADWVVSAATDSLDLHRLTDHGGKLIQYRGLADPLIPPFGSWWYDSNLFDIEGVTETQRHYRSFYFPGNGHCGGNSGFPNAGLINSTDLFNTLVNWVENGVAPDYVVAYNTTAKTSVANGGVTRKICKYPDQVSYASGNPNDQASYTCTALTREPADLKADSTVAIRYYEAP